MTRWAPLRRLALLLALAATTASAAEPPDAAALAALRADFAEAVPRRLAVPEDEARAYAQAAQAMLAMAGDTLARPQFVLVVDRHPRVQAALLFIAAAAPAPWHWVGAGPVSTGRPGGFEHFLTPLGAFAHTLANPDFRAEGSFNDNGIRGYGERGLRVFDFGWTTGERTWGAGGASPMRLQLHATDPARLEPRLGERASKGCVRIGAGFNRFLDRRGVLDADYEAALAAGTPLWVLPPDRQATPWSGRWLVVLETARSARPAWSPAPRTIGASAPPAALAAASPCPSPRSN